MLEHQNLANMSDVPSKPSLLKSYIDKHEMIRVSEEVTADLRAIYGGNDWDLISTLDQSRMVQHARVLPRIQKLLARANKARNLQLERLRKDPLEAMSIPLHTESSVRFPSIVTYMSRSFVRTFEL